ncbi:hypothetical protein EYF80_021561 [Liparis tanakae]|uniref:Uncharacterized protein n=1 Tax=Liparis tanakae TaxID=230148 RepID=A0A4Z2HQX0_9TELE|nr:hypothetical protein EYF80_021561 [Liparis tanakae]
MESPGTLWEAQRASELEINSLGMIKSVKPSVCLSSLVSSRRVIILRLAWGGKLDCQRAASCSSHSILGSGSPSVTNSSKECGGSEIILWGHWDF